MRLLRFTALLCLLLVAPHASATQVVVLASGTYKVGSPVSALLVDACTGRSWGTGEVQEGLDSNCFYVPSGYANDRYHFVVNDESGVAMVGGVNLCFYDQTMQFSLCGQPYDGRVPGWVRYVSLSSYAGTDVHWAFYVAL